MFHLKACLGCRISLEASGFCISCRKDFAAVDPLAKEYQSGSVALYRYQGPIRNAVMRAKVKNDIYALLALANLFSGHEDVLAMAAKCDVIVPTPSSLWGRLRGRYDIAQKCAMALSDETSVPIRTLPWIEYMTSKKRAGANGQASSKFRSTNSRGKLIYKGLSVLIVDDVITTGETMSNTMEKVRSLGAATVVGVALAGKH